MKAEEIKALVSDFDTDATIDLTQRMIQIRSIDPPGKEAEMSQFVKLYLEQAEIAVEAKSVEGLDEERKNIIACLKGRGEAAANYFFSTYGCCASYGPRNETVVI